jgi:hypothetical protein
MTDKKPTYKKEIIEMADYIFANPNKKASEILSFFVGKCRKNKRTVERYIKQAREHNRIRLQEQERIKDEVLAEQIKEAFKRDILSKTEALEILSKIAKGGAREIPVKTILKDGEKKYVEWELHYPSDGERKQAITQLAKMEGWEVPQKIDVDLSQPVIIQKEYEIISQTDTSV